MAKPFIFTLFGSTGDLTQKKVMPALYKLFREGRLASSFYVVAFSRRSWSDEEYRKFIKPYLEQHASAKLEEFLTHIIYAEGHFQDAASFATLTALIHKKEQEIGTAEKLFYLAVQPEFYNDIVTNLAATNIISSPQSKILVEKPFGHDEASARVLEATFEKYITAQQLLRIDHYLAKEGLRMLSASKQHDANLQQKLNAQHVQKISVRVFEKIGIEGRGDFYEKVGALMDVGQNHMMEMLATFLASPDTQDFPHARAKALQSLSLVGKPLFGQYEGYLNEPEVLPESQVETYFTLELASSLPEWKGVPIIMEAGKAMAEKRADIVVLFKDGSEMVFDIQHAPSGRDAYEFIIEEAINGQHDYFVSFEEVVVAWHILEPILKNRATLEVKKYTQGTNGPKL